MGAVNGVHGFMHSIMASLIAYYDVAFSGRKRQAGAGQGPGVTFNLESSRLIRPRTCT